MQRDSSNRKHNLIRILTIIFDYWWLNVLILVLMNHVKKYKCVASSGHAYHILLYAKMWYVLWWFFQSPLHLATYLDLTEVVKSLVEKGASLELQDQNGNTALHVACQQGQMKCATEMTREVSPRMLAPILETQNWRGGAKTRAGSHQPAIHCCWLGRFLCVCIFHPWDVLKLNFQDYATQIFHYIQLYSSTAFWF